jgi:crotonobetainyl-CoA:carnitine CoA-transferase CaiB-like acyl-CoA transferase
VSERTGPLAGMRVIEAARFVTGPYACQMLGDLGADVIKIEDPDGGDPFRSWGTGDGYAPQFVAFNRNKRSLTLDLREDRGRDAVRALLRTADVFVENFRPGVTERLGIGYEDVRAENPRLIYCSITGMGRDGPYAQRPSYDIVGQGLSGLLSQFVELENPRPMGPTLSDMLTGVYAAYGVLAAIQARHTTGLGQRVDTSLLQATIGIMNEPFSWLFGRGSAPKAFDRPRLSQVYAFVCGDALPIAIHLSSPQKFWRAFVTALGQAEMLDDPRLRTHRMRQDLWPEIHARLVPVMRSKTRAEWLEALVAADVPVAPIYALDEVIRDPQVQHLGMIQSVHHPERGERQVVGFPVNLSATPLGPISAPPLLGEHTGAILAELGLGPGDS